MTIYGQPSAFIVEQQVGSDRGGLPQVARGIKRISPDMASKIFTRDSEADEKMQF